MQSAFVIVVVAVGIVGIAGAIASLLLSRRTWESIGRDRLLMESDARARPSAAGRAGALSPAARADRDEEIRQMLQARNARRRRHGEAELDVEAELARLTAAPGAGPEGHVDSELREEVRQLVIARNHRRVARGEPPLDVETEVVRELGRLTR